MGLHDIVTPLDSAVLETKDQYKAYFKLVKHGFNALVDALKQKDICTERELEFLSQYCELMLYSLEAFRVKYLFDDEEKMRIDLTESGFPNYLEFRYLLNDLSLKHEFIEKLPSTEELKTEFLDTLLKQKKPVSDRKLHQAASIVYYSSVDRNYIFRRFVQGKVIRTNDRTIGRNLVSWSFYDVTLNRPFVCYMYFDVHKTSVQDYQADIYEALEKVADRNMDVEMMAYAIDKRLPKLYPRALKMIDLGPLHSIFAKDELAITHTLLKAIGKKDLDLSNFAFSLRSAKIESKGTFKEGSFFNKQHFQIWSEPQRERLLFAPHRTLQILYNDIPDELNLLTQNPIEIPAVTL